MGNSLCLIRLRCRGRHHVGPVGGYHSARYLFRLLFCGWPDLRRCRSAGAFAGRDPEFGRGSNIYQRHLGDPSHSPNPCVAPIEGPPFYALRIHPADLGTAVGLRTDCHARVLRKDGIVIPGLYACGNDMGSIMNGNYPGPGITLGPALTFGYIAGRHLAQTGLKARTRERGQA